MQLIKHNNTIAFVWFRYQNVLIFSKFFYYLCLRKLFLHGLHVLTQLLARQNIFAFTSPVSFSCFKSLQVDRWIKSNVVNTSVVFICKSSMECFNPYFKIFNSSSLSLVPDRFSTVSIGVKGSTTSRVNSRFFTSFLQCVLTVVLIMQFLFFQNFFEFTSSGTHILFDRNYYDQIDGVAIGSSLGPVLANLFRVFMKSNG